MKGERRVHTTLIVLYSEWIEQVSFSFFEKEKPDSLGDFRSTDLSALLHSSK